MGLNISVLQSVISQIFTNRAPTGSGGGSTPIVGDAMLYGTGNATDISTDLWSYTKSWESATSVTYSWTAPGIPGLGNYSWEVSLGTGEDANKIIVKNLGNAYSKELADDYSGTITSTYFHAYYLKKTTKSVPGSSTPVAVDNSAYLFRTELTNPVTVGAGQLMKFAIYNPNYSGRGVCLKFYIDETEGA